MRVKSVVAVLVCAGSLASSVARGQTPTLGDLAKKEEDRRKALKTPGKVVTSQDLPKGSQPRPPTSASEKTPAAAVSDKAAKPDEPARDEAWWRTRVSQVREELRRAEMFAEALQTRINSLTSDFAARDDPYQRARVAEDRVKALAELDRVKADLELHKKKLADIEEEARREGVPPGWLR